MAISTSDVLSDIYTSIYTLRTVVDLDTLGGPLNEILLTSCTVKNWVLFLREDEEDQYVVRFAFTDGKMQRKIHNTSVKLDRGILKWSVRNMKSLFIERIEQDPRFDSNYDAILGAHHVIGNSFVVPLPSHDKEHVLGVLALYNVFLPEESAHLTDLFTVIAMMLSFTIEKLQTVRDIKHQVLTDHLTGLFNRRALVSIAERVIEECLRYNRVISLLIIDVDNFKSINDTEGHLHGDAALVRLATILRDSVRKLDYIIRFAGDEFVVLMPDALASEKDEIIRRIMNNFEANKLPAAVDYTISIGVYSGPPRSLNYMFTKADAEMYMRKSERKRQVEAKRAQASATARE